MFLCQEKGRELRERRQHNAGQPRPEGFRKSQRLMRQAEKFYLPLICLVDTPGASIALEDEERGQAQAIAMNLLTMAQLRVPIVAVVIGEGGSGGALALSMGDRLLMMEYSYYSVSSPEAAATILLLSPTRQLLQYSSASSTMWFQSNLPAIESIRLFAA